jgi:hypothetical protein
VANHPGQNVYYVCVFNPETEEFVHQGHSKHLQVRVCIRDASKTVPSGETVHKGRTKHLRVRV